MSGAKLLVLGVDGLDYDVVLQLGADALPNLHPLVENSAPHEATFPPDSVPSWTTILTGLCPEEHGQLHSMNFLLDGGGSPSVAGLEQWSDRCFWSRSRGGRVAVVNPFLANPPWVPAAQGAMVSGPSFGEGVGEVADPGGLLVGVPPRMGGFSSIPRQRDIAGFAAETAKVARDQYDYALAQLEARRWDVFFNTNLTVDRIQHVAWRHFDSGDPTHPGASNADLIPAAYRQLDAFVGEARNLCEAPDTVVVVSDHGHGRRAHLGVNFHELFRREGLYVVEPGLARRAIETGKTAAMELACRCHAEEPATWLARRLPGRRALKTGAVVGKPKSGSARVVDIGGSNPWGGIATGGDDQLTASISDILSNLSYRGEKLVRWCAAAEDLVRRDAAHRAAYPDILFELEPSFAPTWNLYGSVIAPIVTHKTISGGHTRRAVFASDSTLPNVGDSQGVYGALAALAERT